VNAWRWSTGEKTLRGQMFVHIRPVDDKSATDDPKVFALRLGVAPVAVE
jgi:hypothetical protein